MKFKETTSNLIKGIPKGYPLGSFFWKEWEYETNCEIRSNLPFYRKKWFPFPHIVSIGNDFFFNIFENVLLKGETELQSENRVL